ncbi:BICD family-like cargo adapter 2 isoform X2 [Acipenser ruthenus]|uniref:BICD family-like cargo adapter 2 isoform X2 n=1 Tax=Acipenser ruthenus TaxID=7906 RepID=UPI002741DF8D|nr:BICD family-like cargo adapter 2 isoform X2 [Acipenser ruthenus]
MASLSWRNPDPARVRRLASQSRRDSLSSPSLEEPFFPFPSQRRESMGSPLPPPLEHTSSELLERDLILAAELGQALLERNEELGAKLEERDREIELLKQQCYEMKLKQDSVDLEWSQHRADLESDLGLARAQLEQWQNQDRERRRVEGEELKELSNHNQRLVEQLSEAVRVQHELMSELRTLREEFEERDMKNSIRTARIEGLQAELLQGRADLFEQRSLNHSLQTRIRDRGEEVSFTEPGSFTPSIQSELEQAQRAAVSQEIWTQKVEETQRLENELQCQGAELESLRAEVQRLKQQADQTDKSSLEAELDRVRSERDSLNLQLFNTIQHKVALAQEVEDWQEDMRVVIRQQVRVQSEEEREMERKASVKRKDRSQFNRRSFRGSGEGSEGGSKEGFFSSLFKQN